MRERGDILVGLLVAFVGLFPLGFLVHVSPRFAGSLGGGLLGIAAALLMFLTLPYIAAKHCAWADRQLSRFFTKSTLLAIHIYAGVLAPVLALLHAAHKFESSLGVVLTGLLLLTVMSGFIGRYILAECAKALRGRVSELAALKAAVQGLPVPPQTLIGAPQLSGRWTRYLFTPGDAADQPMKRDREALAVALSDTEYAVRAESAVSTLFTRWRYLHLAAGTVLYLALLLHIGAAVYFGLRWL